MKPTKRERELIEVIIDALIFARQCGGGENDAWYKIGVKVLKKYGIDEYATDAEPVERK